jgi:hypothetical protein
MSLPVLKNWFAWIGDIPGGVTGFGLAGLICSIESVFGQMSKQACGYKVNDIRFVLVTGNCHIH